MSEIWGEYVGVMKICVGIPPVSRATKNLWLTRFGQMWAYLFEKSVRWRQIGNERAVWEHLTPCTLTEMGIVSLKMSFP